MAFISKILPRKKTHTTYGSSKVSSSTPEEASSLNSPSPYVASSRPSISTTQTSHEGKVYDGPCLQDPIHWLHSCQRKHNYCSEVLYSRYRPTRLVDLGWDFDFSRARLIESTQNDPPVDYLTLSYCWGSNMPEAGKTTLSTISAHKQRLRRAKLPRTFKHFFEIAKRLNVRFVWVDSLCIIQDSEDDWQRETARMGQIYSGAICTIAAESAKDCQGGIWLESKTRKTETKNKVIYETITQEENLRNYISVCDQRFHRSPLQRRGWTLQEQNLSRRVLHFTFSHIYWECREQKEDIPVLLAGCDTFACSPAGRMASSQEWQAHKLRPFDVPMENRVSSHNRASSHTKMYVPELSLLSDPFRTWRNIVEEFTSRQLSRSSDRLPALSGLASELQLHMNSEYMVGIWLGDLKGLLWTIGGESIICAARTDDSAPTWSWASYDRYPITYRHISNMFPVAEDENISSAAKMLHPHIIPAGLDPKGRVTYGSIQLKCRVRWVTSSEHIYTSRFTFYREDDHTRYLENCSEENPIMIIRILESRTAGSWGLILKQSIKQGVEEYERVGVIGGIDHRWFDSWFDKMVTLV